MINILQFLLIKVKLLIIGNITNTVVLFVFYFNLKLYGRNNLFEYEKSSFGERVFGPEHC